ncbi:adenylate guanylate cyclase [Chlorella sorokiniana]|uniref:Adenylate guanylate cyclase n=1 Tax=Chlorella sorokiniana TaxID=3076 RepID=A0A2P6TZU0_CHLSO|nr:adenylate guanylate cyclase [Chlorella sorokiniana]|eukprot:PRW59584.1 adenylate guanylate cyclase [Chlorella sorokiniana]
MGIGEWLQGLGLERYTAVFEEQEVDLSVVHAISAEELAGIGITDRLHQGRILQAADAVASVLGLRRLRAAAGGKDGRPAAAKKQRQLILLPTNGSREAADPEAVAARKQPLARGGTAYPVGEETRALKRVKLEALRQELATHEATVAELRRMIAGLERELDG